MQLKKCVGSKETAVVEEDIVSASKPYYRIINISDFMSSDLCTRLSMDSHRGLHLKYLSELDEQDMMKVLDLFDQLDASISIEELSAQSSELSCFVYNKYGIPVGFALCGEYGSKISINHLDALDSSTSSIVMRAINGVFLGLLEKGGDLFYQTISFTTSDKKKVRWANYMLRDLSERIEPI